jgi:hypothetical protein
LRIATEAWTAFEDYPEFMETIETVTIVEDERLHWVAVIEDEAFEWDADLVEYERDGAGTPSAVAGPLGTNPLSHGLAMAAVWTSLSMLVAAVVSRDRRATGTIRPTIV